ncbi:MAG: glycosyltransferase family 39 protein [Chloroflexi bacterium]|nr:glycosyltransferase family 39 protein [Chloroflexota bacterium]
MKTVKRHASRSLLPIPAPHFLLLAILLLASLLRFYRLDAQSFWNDEGNSARLSERTLDLILEGTASDIHPPGYYLLLHYWRGLFGQSEFALRSLSVVAGLALVAFTYLLGRHLFGETTGLMAAFLGAVSPFAVYYSQEARMYALLAVLSAASTYLLLRLLASNRQPATKYPHLGIIAVYVITCAAGLYTQYAFPFVLLAHNVIFGLWWLAVAGRSGNRWRWLVLWIGMQAATVALYLPWLPIALRSVTGWSSAGQTYGLGVALLDVLRVLSVGITLPVDETTGALVGMGVLLLAGLFPRRADRAGWLGVASIALYLLLPIAFIFTFDLYKPAWLKFLLVVLPPFHVVVAHGVENLARSAIRVQPPVACNLAIRILYLASCTLLLGIYLAATSSSLQNLYFDPTYARDDYRQVAADLSAIQSPGDAIILNAPNQWEVFTYYYPDQDVCPAPYRPVPDEVEAFLAPLLKRYQRLFVLYWGDAESDPQRLIETWLATNAYKADDRWYGRVRLATYGVASLPEEPAALLDARFGESIRLNGYTLMGDRFAPGDVLPVTLFWEAQTSVSERYKVTVQLLDGAGQLVAQHDTEPGDGLMPTHAWRPGQAVTDRSGILLPDVLPPGRYTLVVAMYHAVSGERLSVILSGRSVGDYLPLGDVEIGPAQ